MRGWIEVFLRIFERLIRSLFLIIYLFIFAFVYVVGYRRRGYIKLNIFYDRDMFVEVWRNDWEENIVLVK